MKPLCVVSCPIDTFSGYGARSRDFVKALIKVKGEEWDIRILPQRWGETPWNFLHQDDPLRFKFISNLDPNKQPDIWVQITIPNEFQPVGKQLNIGVTAGVETNVFPGDWIEGINRMNFNLISSHHSKDVALNTQYTKKDDKDTIIGTVKCEKPVEVLFEGLDLKKYFKIQKPKTDILNNIPEDFCFLFTGHWLPGDLGEDRKNTGLMIKTFLETFNTPSKKKPALVLKTNQVNYSLLDREEITKKINNIRNMVSGSLPNIYLIHGEMTDEEMNLLNNAPKVKTFLSFAKGEGFGRPLLESAITGKPLIVSHWSGHIDFIKPEYNILVGGDLKQIHPSAANQWLTPESKWFNINPSIASKAMKDVFKHYKKYYESSRKQTQYIKENWSFDKMCDKLNELLKPVNIVSTQQLKLPKLKKVLTPQSKWFNGENNTEKLPKLKLPKLKKIEA